MPATKPLSPEEFLAMMKIEASKLERFAREVAEGKWETFNIEESFTRKGPAQEEAIIVIRASRLQAYGTGRTVMTDGEESAPRRAHRFEGSWQPGERRGIEYERYEETCSACGLTIIDPTDAHVIDGFPSVEALTPEWLEMMGHPKECTPKQVEQPKRPYEPPTLRKLDPHDVIRKLHGALEKEQPTRPTIAETSGLRGPRACSEQANGMAGNGEHQDEQGACKAQASELGDLAVIREPIDKRTGNGDEHRDESGHGSLG